MRDFLTTDLAELSAVRAVCFDVDDTITRANYLLPESFTAMWRLKRAGYLVIPITGRPAGWCNMMIRQWPVDAVVGENGAFYYYRETPSDAAARETIGMTTHPAVQPRDRARLDAIAERILKEFPGTRLAADQFCRIYDVAIDFAEEEPVLPLATAEAIKAVFEREGARAKVSSIHVNAWYGDYDKISMTRIMLRDHFGMTDDRVDRETLFFGDSPNDQPLFAGLPLSVGVGDIRRYEAIMTDLPRYYSDAPDGLGFAAAINRLLDDTAGPV